MADVVTVAGQSLRGRGSSERAPTPPEIGARRTAVRHDEEAGTPHRHEAKSSSKIGPFGLGVVGGKEADERLGRIVWMRSAGCRCKWRDAETATELRRRRLGAPPSPRSAR